MSNRPDLHTPQHDKWDQGGYCNNLVVDDDGCGTVCGYRKPRKELMTDHTNAELIAEARDIWEADDLYPDQMIPRLVKALETANQRAADAEQGLYDVYVALGFDTDGARTPRELFGPMVNGTPAEIVVDAAKEYREDSEREADEADQRAEKRWYGEFKASVGEYQKVIDELAAVIEQTEDYVIRHFLDTAMGKTILEELSHPARAALREVKADVWDEGSQTGFTHGMSYQAGSNDAMYYRNPYRKEQS